MSFFDDLLDVGGDILGGIFGSDAGNQVVTTGLDLLSPQIAEWLYGSADPGQYMTPEQKRAVELNNQARQLQLGAAQQMLPYGTPEAQEAIVRREAARGAYEADIQRRRQVARGVSTPFTSNYYDNIDPIVRRALAISDPTTRAMNVLNQAGATAQGIPSYLGPENAAGLARAEDLYRTGQVQQGLDNILGDNPINLIFGGGGSQVSGFSDPRGPGSSGYEYGNPYGLLI